MTNYERELANILEAQGFGVMRAPASGSGGTRDLPDILYGDRRVCTHDGTEHVRSSAVAVEHKSGRRTTLYVEEAEVAALTRFCDRFGAMPLLGARFTRQATPTAHFLVRPAHARRTDEGNYGLPLDGIEDRATVVFDA